MSMSKLVWAAGTIAAIALLLAAPGDGARASSILPSQQDICRAAETGAWSIERGVGRGRAAAGAGRGAVRGNVSRNRNVNVNRNVNRNRNVNINRNVNRRTVVRRGPTVVVRPVRPWVARPYYGAIIGGVALGTVIAVTAATIAPPPPAPNLCWYWSDASQTQGYWDYC